MKNNVTLDFTQSTQAQDVAIMPAFLAKRLLEEYASNLNFVNWRNIQSNLQILIENSQSYSDMIIRTSEFIQERELVDNINKKNWDAYKVEEEVIAESTLANIDDLA